MRSSDSDKRKRESEIIDMFFRRDPAALKSVSDDYGRLFRRIAFNITSSDTVADEVANDVLLALWKAIPPARPENLSAYGSAVARNIALGRVRSELSGGRPAVEEELDESVPDGLPDDADREALAGLIDAFLKNCPGRTRAVFVMRYFEEEPLERISERTGMSEGAVKSLLHRTRLKLRAYLEREGYRI